MVEINSDVRRLFEKYAEFLLEQNKSFNLTAITERDDIFLKHFVDSLTVYDFVKECKSIIDVGTGAGFPGVPLKLYDDSFSLTLLDSLQKRARFLDELAELLELRNTTILCGRAEDFAQDEIYRESFDGAVSRAVAPLNVLAEYCLPFVKVGGVFVAQKGDAGKRELDGAAVAIATLGGEVEQVEHFELRKDGDFRTIISIRKVHGTPPKYPRRAGMASKKPL